MGLGSSTRVVAFAVTIVVCWPSDPCIEMIPCHTQSTSEEESEVPAAPEPEIDALPASASAVSTTAGKLSVSLPASPPDVLS